MKVQNLTFPHVGDIPWVYKHPSSHLIQWKSRAFYFINYLENKATQVKKEVGEANLLESTKKRLLNLERAYKNNAQSLRRWMSPLLQIGEDIFQIRNCLEEKLSIHLTIDAYLENLFRDWAWETKENKANFEIVSSLLPPNFSKALILGCGSGRLVSDLAETFSHSQFIAIDRNPLMLLTAKNICNGQSIDLYEIPKNPIFCENYSVLQQLQHPNSKPPQNIYWLFADALNPPVKRNSMDVVITPWFIDVVPENFIYLSQRINCYLKKGGVWVNWGPLGYDCKQELMSYSCEEICEILKNQGFKMQKKRVEIQTYLDSPHGGHGRREKIFSFSVEKAFDVKEPKAFQKYPQWLLDTSLPVPQLPSMIDLQMKNKVHFEILSAINSQNSIDDISKLMEQRYQMAPNLAYESLIYFLSNFMENRVS